MSKASPTSRPEITSQRVRPVSSADHRAQAAARHNNVSRASGLLKRNMSTATGVRARASAARWAAVSPAQRRTSRCRISTEATPHSASGTNMAQELNPKTRTDRAWSHSAAGGLSTVMKLPGSIEPKKKAFQLTEALRTAAV